MDKDIIKLVNDRLNGQETFSTGANNYRLWLDMYRDESPWLGTETFSMGLPSSIASELARLTTIEMKSEIANDEDLNVDYQKVVDSARVFTEYGLALGGIILKPFITKDRIEVDYITPDLYIPISFDNSGNIDHIVFIDEVQRGKFYYRRIEEHDLTGSSYIINNSCFMSQSENRLGEEMPLDTLDMWATLAKTATIVNVDKPLFGYFKNPQANNLDLTSPMGVSCYSRATSLIQDVDEQYSRILWEYEGSELAVDADVTALKNSNKLPVRKERLFRNLGLDQPDGFYEVFSPNIRDQSLFNGLNKMLMRVEFTCGLAYGTLSDMQLVTKTAEEIKSSKQRSYSTVVDIQKSLQKALIDLVDAMLILRNFYLNKPIVEPEISFQFDDSLIENTDIIAQRAMLEFQSGLIDKVEYYKKVYKYSEEQAIQLSKEIESRSPQPQDMDFFNSGEE